MGQRIARTVAVILKVIALAMGMAIVVLTALDAVTIATSMTMLGTGLGAIALASFIRGGEVD